MKISEVLAQFETDKHKNEKKGHCYGYVYDQLFKQFDRNAELNILEIGSQFGYSLLAWRTYFPNARITGVDIKDQVENKREDINYVISDVKKLKPAEEFDIIIDDGSHKWRDILYTIKNFKIKTGGLMIIEDCKPDKNYHAEELKKATNYTVEEIDLRGVHGRHDDFLVVLRKYVDHK